MATTQPTSAENEPVVPSHSWRLTVSFLLFVHLFFLFAGVVSWQPQPLLSNLAGRLQNVPGMGPYLQLLEMRQNYRYALTGGDELDTDHAFVVELKPREGEPVTVQLPPDDLWPAIRRQRYQRMGQQLAQYDEGNFDVPASLIAECVALGLVRQHDAVSGQLRLRRHYLQQPDARTAGNAEARDPYSPAYYRDVYTTNIFVDNGQVNVLKVVPEGETAPTATGAANASGAGSMPPATNAGSSQP